MLGHRVSTINDQVVCTVYVIILNTWHCTFSWHSVINRLHNLILIHDLELRSANEHPFSCNQRIWKRKQSLGTFSFNPHMLQIRKLKYRRGGKCPMQGEQELRTRLPLQSFFCHTLLFSTNERNKVSASPRLLKRTRIRVSPTHLKGTIIITSISRVLLYARQTLRYQGSKRLNSPSITMRFLPLSGIMIKIDSTDSGSWLPKFTSAPLLMSCVTFLLLFLHLWNESNNSTYLTG